MTEKQSYAPAIDRRTFLRQVGAVGVGLGIALKRSTGSATTGKSVDSIAIQELREQLGSSKVLTPEDTDYVRTGLPMNGIYRAIRPAVIARCTDAKDVSTCVTWSTKHQVSPVVRGGGHSYAGYSTTTGLLIDIGLLNTVQVNEEKHTAVVGGAALNRDVYTVTKGRPYFLPAGTCLGVGVGGLVLGGGIGYNSRWAGLTCDRLRSTRIVTASGDVLEASAETNADLFWACRGGAGGSFGVNTEFTFELVPVPTTSVTYFQLEWLGADMAIKVFAAFNALMATKEPRLNATARAQAVEITQGRSARDAIDVRSRGQFLGPQVELMRLLQSFPPPNKSAWEIKEMSYWDAAQRFVAEGEPSHSFGDISRYAQQPITQETIAAQIELLTKCPSRSQDANGSMWSLGWVGGSVINAIGRQDTAYVHRGVMSTLLRPTCIWPDNAAESVGRDLLAWTEAMIELIAKETPNESYQNFPNRLIKDGLTQYYAENLDRLIDVKMKYDGKNLFNNAQSIPLRG